MVHRRRVRNLENILHVGDEMRLTEQEREFLCWLSQPSALQVLEDFAAWRARRHYLWETGQPGDEVLPSGLVQLGSSGWYRLPDEDRHSRALAEIEGLEALRAEFDDDTALTRWLDQPDAEHWPSLLEPTNRRAFDQRLHQERQMIDGHRGNSGTLGVIWRRHYPGWQLAMSGDAYDAFEGQLLSTSAPW